MEKKNMVLLTVIAVATLLVAVVGATFAYFTASITDNRDGQADKGQAAITAAQTPGSLIIDKSDEGFSSFNDTNVYPGHKALIQLKVTSNAQNTTNTYFNIVYKGTNNFPNDKIKFTIYESKKEITGTSANKAFNCVQHSDPINGGPNYKLYETCELDEQLKNTLGTTHIVNTELLQKNDDEVILNGEHPFLITGTSTDKTMYYYIVVEYVNNDSADQSANEVGQSLSGNISIEIAPNDNNAISDEDSSKLTSPQA